MSKLMSTIPDKKPYRVYIVRPRNHNGFGYIFFNEKKKINYYS